MTTDQVRKLISLVNVLAEAEREYVRCKIQYTSIGRRKGWEHRLRKAKHEFLDFVEEIKEDMPHDY